MIRKNRLRFIATFMASTFILFALIFAVSALTIKKNSNKHITDELIRVSSTYEEDRTLYRKDALIIFLYAEGYHEVVYTSSAYSQEIITDILELNTNLQSGSTEKIFFSATTFPQGTLIVALDMSDYLLVIRALINKILVVLLIFYALVSLLICASSIKVFRPLQESVFRQRQFISDAGHELKTPLTIISASCDVLSKTDDNKYVQNIAEQAKRLEFLVNDMLTLARIDEEKFMVVKEDFLLDGVVCECVLPFEETAFECGKLFIVDVDENMVMKGDPKVVKTIVNILMDNAFKYSQDKGVIKVSLKVVNNKRVLTVFNTGSEILDENSNKIFERFYRGDDSRSRELGGNGLGLAIVKNLCSLNGYSVSAVSKYKESMEIKVIF